MELNAANGAPLDVLGVLFRLPLHLETSRRGDALVIRSLASDRILLDKGVMSLLGAVLDWHNERLTFELSKATIPRFPP